MVIVGSRVMVPYCITLHDAMAMSTVPPHTMLQCVLKVLHTPEVCYVASDTSTKKQC